MKKERIDKLLFEKGLAKSRTEAQVLILSSAVKVNGIRINKPSIEIPFNSNVEIEKNERFVSRGAYKLIKAIDRFNIAVEEKICTDIGCSTGGFTEILLKKGAKKVYAVDVGKGQLDISLKNNERVIVLEKTNARYITERDIPEKIDLATIDVSFISVEKILNPIKEIGKEDLKVVILIKPQFEVGREFVSRGGIVRKKEYIINMIEEKFDFFYKIDLIPKGLTYSPIKGAKGNIEYLVYLTTEERNGLSKSIIKEVVYESWDIFKEKD